MLLTQLAGALENNFKIFEKAYNDSDKELFDNSKSAILEVQKKINIILG